MFSRYILNILLALDCMLNAVLGGDYRETMSGRMGKLLRAWGENKSNAGRYRIAKSICFLLSLIDKGHCEKSIQKNEPDIGKYDVWEFSKREKAKGE